MARYREFRKIDSEMVRSMCIRECYYTRGDVDAYTHLLVDLCDFKKEITIDDLEEITEDILEHSDVKSFCGMYGCSEKELFQSTLWKLINECCKTFVERI